MRIAVIGAGNIGGTLGKRWAQKGHDVRFGLREGSRRDDAALRASGAGVATIAEALADADVVLLALPGAAVPEFLASYGAALNGKLVFDATNQRGSAVMHQVEQIRRAAPQARVYRAFNSLGWEVFENPQIDGQQADMFFCGAENGQDEAARLIADIGVRPRYLGSDEQLPLLDALTQVWFILAFQRGHGRHTALRVLSDS
ncbi:MAG: NAD(P)-binding domain-containing protein [Chloroflexi bacterium]|nr:NAD(P)-binding domain-containing protein [Chloroflexota bacterium]